MQMASERLLETEKIGVVNPSEGIVDFQLIEYEGETGIDPERVKAFVVHITELYTVLASFYKSRITSPSDILTLVAAFSLDSCPKKKLLRPLGLLLTSGSIESGFGNTIRMTGNWSRSQKPSMSLRNYISRFRTAQSHQKMAEFSRNER